MIRADLKVMVALALLGMTTVASATLLHVEVTGTVATVTDPDGLLPWAGLIPGATPVVLSFSYDDEMPADAYATGYAEYPAQPMSLSVNGDALTYAANNIGIFNDRESSLQPGTYHDTWQVAAGKRQLNAPAPDLIRSVSLVLVSSGGSLPIPVLDSTDLVPPLWPGSWQIGQIAFYVMLQEQGSPNFQILSQMKADVSSIVVTPLPPTIPLLASALGALGGVVARKRAR